MRVRPIDVDRAIQAVIDLMALPGGSGDESAVAAKLATTLQDGELDGLTVRYDEAASRSPFGGSCGNLIAELPGSPGREQAPRLLLSAHLDTVPLCIGSDPVREEGGRIVAAAQDTALGADNRSGCAALLTAALELGQQQLPHPPLVFVFFVQEELGLVGSRLLDLSALGPIAGAVNVDGGCPELIVTGAIGGHKWQATVHGVSAHAGVHPEDGVSAAAIYARAHAELLAAGWHGAIRKRAGRGTANIGMLSGGSATNVTMDCLSVTGECRSHSSRFLDQITSTYRRALARSAAGLRNAQGECGRVDFEIINEYPAYRVGRGDAIVQLVARAARSLQLQPRFKTVDGGVDASNLCGRHGVPAVTIGAGAHRLHTIHEFLQISEYLDSCRLLLAICEQGLES